jgi:hypothetical protein
MPFLTLIHIKSGARWILELIFEFRFGSGVGRRGRVPNGASSWLDATLAAAAAGPPGCVAMPHGCLSTAAEGETSY